MNFAELVEAQKVNVTQELESLSKSIDGPPLGDWYFNIANMKGGQKNGKVYWCFEAVLTKNSEGKEAEEEKGATTLCYLTVPENSKRRLDGFSTGL